MALISSEIEMEVVLFEGVTVGVFIYYRNSNTSGVTTLSN